MKYILRKIACLAVLTFVFINDTDAFPCAPDSLSGYIALGTSGCTIGNVLFSDFKSLDPLTGATPVDPNAIGVTPLNIVLNPGFDFNLNLNSGPGEVTEALIGYVVSKSLFAANTLSMAGSSVSTDGAVTVVEDKCLEGDFGPDGITGCTGVLLTQIVFDIGIDGDLFEKIGFAPVPRINVINDIVADGGLIGSGSLVSVANQFQVIPEPTTAVLFLFGFGGLIFYLRRQQH